ncbi:MAG: flavodoxin family protein [Candidatus Omnitrophota bacterium]
MKILGIGGSPRKGGNTDILLDKALEGAGSAGASVEKIVLNDLEFKPCQECGGCRKTGACVIRDGMCAIYDKIKEADGLILASPVFFGSLSAQMKTMIDRFQCAWIKKYMLKIRDGKKRRGIFLSAGGYDKNDFFENARQIVKVFFKTIDTEYAGELFCGRIEDAGDINKRPDLLERAFRLGYQLIPPNSKLTNNA